MRRGADCDDCAVIAVHCTPWLKGNLILRGVLRYVGLDDGPKKSCFKTPEGKRPEPRPTPRISRLMRMHMQLRWLARSTSQAKAESSCAITGRAGSSA